MTRKPCSVCKVTLSANQFCQDRRSSDGLQAACRACSSARQRKAYASNLEKSRARRMAYCHNNKERVSAANKKSKDKHKESVAIRQRSYYERVRLEPEYLTKRDARTARNKVAKRAYDRLYRKLNKARLDQLKTIWVANNKPLVRVIKTAYKARRRAVEKTGDSSRDIKQWIDQQALVCRWCKKDCADNYHVDHIKALARGGTHTIANLCIACPPCNLSKNARCHKEFEAEMQAKLNPLSTDAPDS